MHEIQTLPADTDRILDAIIEVYPLAYGKYERNASVSAVGKETARPPAGSTTATHVEDFAPGSTETYPMVAGIEDGKPMGSFSVNDVGAEGLEPHAGRSDKSPHPRS